MAETLMATKLTQMQRRTEIRTKTRRVSRTLMLAVSHPSSMNLAKKLTSVHESLTVGVTMKIG